MAEGAADSGTHRVGEIGNGERRLTPPITAADVFEFLQQNFDELNTDKSAGLSAAELDRHPPNARDSEIAHFLDNTRQYIARLYDDEPGYESEITMQDIQALKDGKIDLSRVAATRMALDSLMQKEGLMKGGGLLVATGMAFGIASPFAPATAALTGFYFIDETGKGVKNYYEQKDSVGRLFSK
jgi:hypothetical protein